MKHSLFFLFILPSLSVLGLPAAAIAQINNGVTNAYTVRLDTLLDQKEYFRLDGELKRFKENLTENQSLYYQCFVDNAFNRNKTCIANIDKILKIETPGLPDSAKAALLLLQADSYFKQFQYARAAHNDSIVLSRYTNWLGHKAMLNDVKNDLLISKALQDISPQETSIPNTTTLKWKKDRMGLINVPVSINSETINSIVDTKANLSCITKSYAAKLKIKILDATVEDGSGITGIRFKNGLGLADSIYIGDILVKNVVFLVMPDDKLQFGPFSIHLIIGYPVLEQLGELQFYKDGRLVIPATTTEGNWHNMALDGLNPVLSLKAGDDTLCFHIDLGAQQSRLYATYLERYRERIEKEGKRTSVKLGGAGGSKRKEIYVIPLLNITVDDKAIMLKKVSVFTEKLSPQERYYGILGMDFINNFDEFTFNFRSMYFRVK